MYGMRQLFFFLIFFIGLFWVIDVIAFKGQNSADAWQETKQLGEKFSSGARDQIGRIWR
jgi:hypothetical protein